MSSYSQPLNTISYSDHQINNHYAIYPKYSKQQYDENLDSTSDHPHNKLPLNLFHSAAQYNKMLITYGKNRRQNSGSQIIDGVISSLQYVNDRIFQEQIQKRQKAINNIVSTNQKSSKRDSLNCTCCCCHEFCAQCVKQRQKCSKISQSDIIKARHTIDREIDIARSKPITSYKYKKQLVKHSRKIHDKHANDRRASSAFDKKNSKISQNDSQNIDLSRKSQGKDISHLLIKSMIQFNEKKKIEQLMKIQNANSKKVKEQFLDQYNYHIRLFNLQNTKKSKPKAAQKPLSKHKLAAHYWEKVKDKVADSFQADTYSNTLKKQLLSYNLNIYDHVQLPKREFLISRQQMEHDRKNLQKQALQRLSMQKLKQQQKALKLKRNLKTLQKNRLMRLHSCQKKPFRPTAQVIHNAFKNLVQQKVQKKVEKEGKDKEKDRKRVKKN